MPQPMAARGDTLHARDGRWENSSTQPDGGLGYPVKGTISRIKAPCITQVYCYTTTEGNIYFEGGREGNLKRTVDERLAAARENSLVIVGNDAQGTKPLTWQQRERVEESADAQSSIHAARRGALGGSRATCPCARERRQTGVAAEKQEQDAFR